MLDKITNLTPAQQKALDQIKALFCDPAKQHALDAFVAGKGLMFIDDMDGELMCVPVNADGLPEVKTEFGPMPVMGTGGFGMN